MSMNFSIIVVTHNNIIQTIRCLDSLLRTVPEQTSEILVVDNDSTDGTRAYLAELALRETRLIVHPLDENTGWCVAANHGLRAARGDYLVLLNNDTVVPDGWLTGLRTCLDAAGAEFAGSGPVGLVGPVSNAVGGMQQVEGPPTNDWQVVNQHAAAWRKQQHGNWQRTWFLSGFCLMTTRSFYEDVGGLDPRFSPGGFDDNDWVLRAEERGWTCVVAADTFVYHEGGATFRNYRPDMNLGLANRAKFTQKWRERRTAQPKLVAAYRVKNAKDFIQESLDATARFADAIVVLDDGSTDGTSDLLRNHPAVTRYEYQDLPFDERRDRNRILETAASLGADWIITVDADEIFEMDRARAHTLMTLNDPHVKVLGFHWYTFWDPDHHWYRADGIFGNMSGYRMYKVQPHQKIVDGTPEGLHCGNIPQFSEGARRFTNIRVRHLGYDSEGLRRAKYNFYRDIDKNPRAELVGNTTYDHLISSTVTLRRYQKRHGLSLCIITKNEAERLEAFLDAWQPFVDEICVVDTGSSDETVAIASCFTRKIQHFRMDGLQLDEARNRAKAMAEQPWILTMDPDEVIEPQYLQQFQRLLDDPEPHAYSFEVANHQKDNPPVQTLAVRLFRNVPEIYYTRPVHETVEQSLSHIPEANLQPSHIPIQHYGFLKSDQRVQAKVDAYYLANKKYRESNPKDALPWFNEALHLLNEGDVRAAGACFEHALSLDEKFLSPYAQLAFIHQEQAMRLWQSLLEHAPPGHPICDQANQSMHNLMRFTPPRPIVGERRRQQVAGEGEDGEP